MSQRVLKLPASTFEKSNKKPKTKKIIRNDNNLPFGRMLFLRVHVTFGVGLPEAEHSILTDDPFLTCKCPPELM